jgi:hypothetical protein
VAVANPSDPLYDALARIAGRGAFGAYSAAPIGLPPPPAPPAAAAAPPLAVPPPPISAKTKEEAETAWQLRRLSHRIR